MFREWWKLRNPIAALRQARAYVVEGWAGMGETLAEVAAGAQLIVSGTTSQEVAAKVAEAQGVPLAALHYFPFACPNRLSADCGLPPNGRTGAC